MTRPFILLLRAVNVGGTGKLPMPALKSLCEEAGCADVRTYIASGNVVARSALDEAALKAEIEARLLRLIGKPTAVMVRSTEEMVECLAASPFAERDPARSVICFLDEAPPADALDHVKNRTTEALALGKREIHMFYPDGQGVSRLAHPLFKLGTARNLNTARKLLEMARALG